MYVCVCLCAWSGHHSQRVPAAALLQQRVMTEYVYAMYMLGHHSQRVPAAALLQQHCTDDGQCQRYKKKNRRSHRIFRQCIYEHVIQGKPPVVTEYVYASSVYQLYLMLCALYILCLMPYIHIRLLCLMALEAEGTDSTVCVCMRVTLFLFLRPEIAMLRV